MAAAIASLLLLAFSASAQTVITPLVRPDPATITVPDTTFTPTKSDLRRFDEYFYFYKAGVGYERAFGDLDQCRTYGEASKLLTMPPTFVPMGGDVIKEPLFKPGIYPPPGILVTYLIQNAEEDNVRATVRRCMEYKGYGRYGLSRAIYKKIDTGTDAENLARLALIASGHQPAAEAIDP